MASLDYSKWDSLNEDSDEDNQREPIPPRRDYSDLKVIQQTPKGTEKGRHAFVHNGAKICKLIIDEFDVFIT